MADIFSKRKRSEIMRKVKGKNTKPELAVRKLIYSLGYRYRLHSESLPGHPDIVFSKLRKVVFVHGCFWHKHKGCSKALPPKTNTMFWKNKLVSNQKRDIKVQSALKREGWKVCIVWQCEIKNLDKLSSKVVRFLSR